MRHGLPGGLDAVGLTDEPQRCEGRVPSEVHSTRQSHSATCTGAAQWREREEVVGEGIDSK